MPMPLHAQSDNFVAYKNAAHGYSICFPDDFHVEGYGMDPENIKGYENVLLKEDASMRIISTQSPQRLSLREFSESIWTYNSPAQHQAYAQVVTPLQKGENYYFFQINEGFFSFLNSGGEMLFSKPKTVIIKEGLDYRYYIFYLDTKFIDTFLPIIRTLQVFEIQKDGGATIENGCIYDTTGTDQIMNIENATISYPSESSYVLPIPADWTYQSIPGTEFEVPLPHSGVLEGDPVIVRSSKEYDPSSDQYFEYFLQKIEGVQSFEEYIEGLCYTFSGDTHQSAPFGRAVSYVLEDHIQINGIDLYRSEEDCSIDSITAFVLVYDNAVYRYGVFDLGKKINNDLRHTSFMNIRPIENTPVIQYLLDHGIASGYPDGTFHPNDPINRAEFTKIIVGAVGLGTEGLCKMASFSDVMGTEWYGPFSQAARCAGIIGGYSDGTFRPADKINTAEAAKIVAKAFELTAEESETDPWFQPYMQAIRDIDALPSSAQDPAYLLTRGEVAEIIYRVMTRTE